jgi:hypothetical protein
MAAREAAAMPLPKEETTPPVTNTYRVMTAFFLIKKIGTTLNDHEKQALVDLQTPHQNGKSDYQKGGVSSIESAGVYCETCR